jgi:hypothetical protein
VLVVMVELLLTQLRVEILSLVQFPQLVVVEAV